MASSVSIKDLRAVAGDLHSLKEGVAVHEKEYGLPEEVVRTINSKITRIAKKLADV